MAINTPNIFPKHFRITTHLLSVFIPSLLISLSVGLGLIMSDRSHSFLGSMGLILLVTLGYALPFFLLYLLAGGMEWKTENLPRVRAYLFFTFTLILFGFLLYGVWYLIRYLMAKYYKVPLTAARGRLLNIKWEAPKLEIQEQPKGPPLDLNPRQQQRNQLVGDFGRITGPNNEITGIWLRDASVAQNGVTLTLLLRKLGLSKDVMAKVGMGYYRVIPSSQSELGVCMVMWDMPVGPDQTPPMPPVTLF
jgi:hypothetical protein